MKSNKLYEDKEIVLERFDDCQYRVTFFKPDNHWGGEIMFDKEHGVIYDDVKDTENNSKIVSYGGYSIGDRVKHTEYIIKYTEIEGVSIPCANIVGVEVYEGTILSFSGLCSDIALPSVLVKFDNWGEKYLPLNDICKI